VPFENNHTERSIRPAVILRKNSYGNRSQIIVHNEWPPSASGKDDPKIIMCENI
jgi:hypothetical protein